MRPGRGARIGFAFLGLILLGAALAWYEIRKAPMWHEALARALTSAAPGASWQHAHLRLWPWPALELTELAWRNASIRLHASRAQVSFDLGALLLRGKAKLEKLRLFQPEIVLRDTKPALPPFAVEIVYGRVRWRKLELKEAFLSFARDRAELRWDGRARIGRGSVRSFGVWPLQAGAGRGYATVRLEHAPFARFVQGAAPQAALIDGALALRGTGDGWDARWEFRVHANGARWAHTRGRLRAQGQRVRIDEAFLHLGAGAMRFDGGCNAARQCTLKAHLARIPAFALQWLWPDRTYPPTYFQGALSGTLDIHNQPWRATGTIRPQKLRLGWQKDALLALPAGPWQVRWQAQQGELRWAHGHVRWRLHALQTRWEIAAQGADAPLLAALIAARMGTTLRAEGKGRLQLAWAQTPAKQTLAASWDLLGSDLRWKNLHKPASAPFSCTLRWQHSTTRDLLAFSACRAPGLFLDDVRISTSQQPTTNTPLIALRLKGLRWDAEEAQRLGLKLGHAIAGRLQAKRFAAALWPSGRLAAEGRMQAEGLRWDIFRLACTVVAKNNRVHAEPCAFAFAGLAWRGRLRARLDTRYLVARAEQMRMVPQAFQVRLPAWTLPLRHWHVRMPLRHAEIVWPQTPLLQDGHGLCEWSEGAWACSLQGRWAQGTLELHEVLLEPRAQGWLIDGKLHIAHARLSQATGLGRWLGAELAGRMDLALWFRLRTPASFARWRASGDLAVYGLRYRTPHAALAAKKLEARLYANGKRLRIEPLVLIQQKRIWRGRAWITPPAGELSGELVAQGMRARLAGTVKQPQVELISRSAGSSKTQ